MMKKFTTLLIVGLMFSGSVYALPEPPAPKQVSHDLMKVNRRKAPASRAGEGVSLTVNLDYDMSSYQAKNIAVYNENYFNEGFYFQFIPDDESKGEAPLFENLEPGIYTVMASFEDTSWIPGYPWTKCYVFLEDVEVKENTSVTLSAADATFQFKGASYLPDGKEAKVDAYVYDDAGDYEYVEGNTIDKLIQTTIFDTKYNAWIVSAVVSAGSYTMDNFYGPGINWAPEEMHNIRVNNISDRFIITQQRDNYLKDGFCSTVAYSLGVSSLDLSNDVANYRYVDPAFTHTPFYELFGEGMDTSYQYTMLGYKGWGYTPYEMIPWQMRSPMTMSYSESSNASEVEDMHSTYRFSMMEGMVDWEEVYLKSQRLAFDNDGGYYLFSNFFSAPEVSGTRAVDADGEEVYYQFPGQPGLQVNVTPDFDYTFGSSAPYNAMAPLVYRYRYEDRFVTNLNPVYKGLLGEEREGDKVNLKVAAAHNGVTAEVDGETWNAYWNATPNDDATGAYEATFTDDQNVLVEGQLGYNTTTLSFSYGGEDICPPAIQAVQFRSVDGKFGMKFGSLEEMKIVVCAGDYDWWETEDYLEYNYTSKPVEVKVEIALHDATDKEWSELEMKENEELANLAGYGLFFEGSADGVENAEGWYDVRVTATDAAGNSNRQEFGPAFYIDPALSGVKSVAAAATGILFADGVVRMAEGGEALFAVYSADGRRVAECLDTEYDLSALEAGLYVVAATKDGVTVSAKIRK